MVGRARSAGRSGNVQRVIGLVALCLVATVVAGCGGSDSESPPPEKPKNLQATLEDAGLGYQSDQIISRESGPTPTEAALTGPNGEITDGLLAVERYAAASEAEAALTAYRDELARPEGGRGEAVGRFLVFVSTQAPEGLTPEELADFETVVGKLRSQ